MLFYPGDVLINFEIIFAFQCPGGEIGRRTVFRSQRSQGCAGSNPVPGTLSNFDVAFFIAQYAVLTTISCVFVPLVSSFIFNSLRAFCY